MLKSKKITPNFLSQLTAGTNVSAEDASYDGNGTLNRARLELEG